jgi:hypothetical protein
MNKKLKITLNIIIYIFAGIGLFLTAGYFAVKFGFTNTKGIIDNQTKSFYNNNSQSQATTTNVTTPVEWAKTEEWAIFSDAVKKDKNVLARVESETGISARLIVSVLAVEQLRLFTSEREIFKQAFAPLKILGTQSQFSWGVMGIKPETAKVIESNLKDIASPFYLGKAFENRLDFKTEDPDQERFTRITDEHDRYYAYLYGAIYIKEFIDAWKKSGQGDISNKPEIIGTLYNIGFDHFEPKADPQVGGAEIEIEGIKYSFGRLTYEIYNSNELVNFYPKTNF